MSRVVNRRFVIGVLAAVLVAMGAGCGRRSTDDREARNRHLRRAFAAKQAQDIDGAIRWAQRALVRRPDLALAHRELALMYDNFIEDHELALYHYRRYLELRPESPNREAVEDLIRHCRVWIAKGMAESPAEWRRDLEARNARIQQLERELAGLRETAARGTGTAATPAPRARPAGEPAPPAAAARTHVVQAGETLGTISQRYYGTPAHWNRIFEANRDRMSNANNVRVGTTLVIPP